MKFQQHLDHIIQNKLDYSLAARYLIGKGFLPDVKGNFGCDTPTDANDGFCNIGVRNTGNCNIGNDNEGCHNAGHGNVGDRNRGDSNHGSKNIGYGNQGDGNIGSDQQSDS